MTPGENMMLMVKEDELEQIARETERWYHSKECKKFEKDARKFLAGLVVVLA